MLDNLKRWSLIAVNLVFIVIVLGAYTRLKDAGLGCPDWPGCYGEILAPTTNQVFSNTEVKKAWIEMIHRYVAGSLGLLVLAITIKTISKRKTVTRLWPLALTILALVVFQALLGMWTVTLRLYPMVVMGHLLGGFAILALIWLLYLRVNYTPIDLPTPKNIRLLAYGCLIILITQIALGGWTSANYAALVCADFPSCQGSLWPNMDWRGAFNLTAVGIFDSPGTPLENTARVTIQMFHRVGALITTIFITLLSYKLINSKLVTLRRLGILLVIAISLQVLLGIGNVLLQLPIAISLMHNAVAAILLVLMVTILFNIHANNRIDS